MNKIEYLVEIRDREKEFLKVSENKVIFHSNNLEIINQLIAEQERTDA